MLPWLFPTYLIFAFVGLVTSAIFGETRWSSILWTFIVICTINLMILTVQSPPHLEGGPGGLTVFGLIPNCIVFGICAVILLFLLIFHPAWKLLGNLWLLLAVIPWAVIAYIFASVPWMWGYYPLEVHVIDWQGKPLPGVKIHFLEERTGISLEQAFLSDDVTGDTITDSNGNAVYSVDNYRRIFGAVNGYWQDPGDKNLGNSSFSLQPYGVGFYSGKSPEKQELQISWTGKGQRPGMNDKFFTASVSRPHLRTLIIYLPGAGGEDVSPYRPDDTNL